MYQSAKRKVIHTGLAFLALGALATGCARPAVVDARQAQVVVAPSGKGPARAQSAMVTSATELASRVGEEILRAGGNAVDAAIATGFALAVTYPQAGNIGGGGFMVIRFPDGTSTAIDFREKAPLSAHPEMFLDSAGNYSYDIHHNSHIAVGVPGTVAGLELAHKKYGKLPWAKLVEPSVRLAADGFPMMSYLSRSLKGVLPDMKKYPASVAAYSKNGVPYEVGELFRQPDLARTLERIRDQGRDGFYKGETARLIVEEMKRHGGLITYEDLERYEAKERAPVRGTYRGYEIISMPPPSSGGVALIQMLNILEGFDLKSMGHNSPKYLHHLAETMRLAFRDRARHLGDPDFEEIPVAALTDKAYAAELRALIDPNRATPSRLEDVAGVALAPESMETTHYSVVDKDGMAVAVTYTLEASYGMKAVVEGAGFLLNNEMGDFNGKPGLTNETGLIGTKANLARPEKRMLSSMTPTILAKDGKLFAVVGSPGGRTIINTVLQVVLNMIDFEMDVQDAVDAKRIHHQWFPDQIRMEPGSDSKTAEALRAMGHKVTVTRSTQGRSHSIKIDPATGMRIGAADPRDGDAGAVGH